MKARWENGRIIPLTPWIEVGEFAPAGPCDSTGASETLVFSAAPVNANTGNPDSSVQVCAAGSLFWFGPDYHNPYYANDIASLSDTSFNGANVNSLTHFWEWNPNLDNNTDDNSDTQNCVIAIFAVEEFDAECADVHEQSAGEGVILDYGSLSEGFWYSSACLDGLEFALPSTPADDGDPGTELLGGYLVVYGQAFDPESGITLATGAQPMLWHNRLNNPQVGDSTSTQFDDDAPADGDHTSPTECYNYTLNLSSFGCPNPSLLGGAIAFWAEAAGCTPSGGDVDGNGCVDDADLLAILFAFGGSGGAEDVNCDGVVDDADLLEVLFNFGNGC
ncbi:MAG: hypothetical protein K6U12_09470 [Armatimonadetes bacterium]|nr:hypothetical protein [Armatimonadota bacterium]